MSEMDERPESHREEGFEPGAELDNYTKRIINSDGTLVRVVTHTERLEKIPQPPTPEEIAEQKKQDKIVLGILGGLGLAFLTFIGVMTYMDEKNNRRPVLEKPAEPITSLPASEPAA